MIRRARSSGHRSAPSTEGAGLNGSAAAYRTYTLATQPGRFSLSRLSLPALVMVVAMVLIVVLTIVFFGWVAGVLVSCFAFVAFVAFGSPPCTAVRAGTSRNEEISDEH